jgi:hypothetical protein
VIVYDLIDCGVPTHTLNIGETTILREGDSRYRGPSLTTPRKPYTHTYQVS